MSLTQKDLQAIKEVVDDAVPAAVHEAMRPIKAEIKETVEEVIRPIQAELKALRNDVNEIYSMITKLEANQLNLSKDDNIETKILKIHSDLVKAAKQAGVKLPAHNEAL